MPCANSIGVEFVCLFREMRVNTTNALTRMTVYKYAKLRINARRVSNQFIHVKAGRRGKVWLLDSFVIEVLVLHMKCIESVTSMLGILSLLKSVYSI